MAKRVVPDNPGDEMAYRGLGVSQDEMQIGNDGKVFLTFMKGLAPFFTTATALEKTATAKLERARALAPPANADEDVAIQEFVKDVNRDDADIENHWSICGVLYRLHRRSTEARDRGKNMNKTSRQIGTKLHNDYVDAEKRRAAAKQEEERQARELEARQKQEAEAAELEQQAIDLEAQRPDLSEREEEFVEMMVNGNVHTARNQPVTCAQVAGYKDPVKSAERLMKTPKIQAAIQQRQDANRLREQATAVKKAPVDVRTEEVKPDIKKAAQTHDRVTWGAEVLDVDRLTQAVMDALHGVDGPLSISAAIDLVKAGMRSQEVRTAINEYGKRMHENIDRWPGVRHTKKVTIV